MLLPIVSAPFARSVSLLGLTVVILFGCAHRSPADVEVNLVALNDFHGYILPSSYRYTDLLNPGQSLAQDMGGVATLGGMLKELRTEDPELLFVGVGDLVGASPPISNMWADEPSILALNLLGMNLSVVGNHEFDEGKDELLRHMKGGCTSSRPDKACQFEAVFNGAQFPYIAANVVDEVTGKLILSPYVIEEVKGVKIAFVGAEVEELASLIAPSSMVGISVADEAEAINRYVPELQARGVQAIVAVVHQGGKSGGTFSGCDNLTGDIVDIAGRLDSAVDVVLSAHTHEAYICQLGKLTITQGASYGHMLTHLRLSINPESGNITQVQAENLLADPARYAPDPVLQQFADKLEARGRAVLQQPIARIGARSITRERILAGESAMGDLVADAQLAATHQLGAQLALMNSGGIRSDLQAPDSGEPLTFSQVSAVHPFKGTLQLLTLSGAELKALLEQQWRDNTGDGFRPLQISSSMSYQWDATRSLGDKVLIDSILVEGKPLKPTADYRIALNAFLADGGDNFSLFKQGRKRQDSEVRDLDALIDYLVAQDKLGKPAGQSEPAGRIQRHN